MQRKQRQLNTDLVAAIQADNADLTRSLLEQGADPNTRRRTGLFTDRSRPALLIALGEIPVVTFDAHKTEINDEDQRAILAAESYLPPNENIALITALLDAGAYVNTRGEDRISLLMVAARHYRLDTMRLLLDRGAYVNAQQKYHHSALYYALHDRNTLRLLLEYGANYYQWDALGWPILTHAVWDGDLTAMETLLEWGVDPNYTGQTPESAYNVCHHLNDKADTGRRMLIDAGYIVRERDIPPQR